MHPRHSLTFKILATGFLFLCIALASIALTLWISWQLEGGAAAVNEAGRLVPHPALPQHAQLRQRRGIAPPPHAAFQQGGQGLLGVRQRQVGCGNSPGYNSARAFRVSQYAAATVGHECPARRTASP